MDKAFDSYQEPPGGMPCRVSRPSAPPLQEPPIDMAEDAIAKTAALVKRATGKDAKQLEEQVQTTATGGQLPLFPEEDTSALPNYLARTPLFAPIQPGRRQMHDNTLLASPEGVEVRFTGKQLDMADQDVFMLALKFAQGVDLTQPVRLNRAEFLKALGWKPTGKTGAFGKSAYEWLEQSFQRLSGTLTIKTKRYKAHLPLVSEFVQDNKTGEWEFTIGGKIRTLFQNDEFSFIDIRKRQQIANRVDMGKWLQSYAASHERGLHRISVIKLKEWCGYRSPLRKFREALAEALQEIERVGILANVAFYKDDTMVKWTRS
jgi:hypothetical protein